MAEDGAEIGTGAEVSALLTPTQSSDVSLDMWADGVLSDFDPDGAMPWTTGLFACFEDLSACCQTTWCPCVTAYAIESEGLGESTDCALCARCPLACGSPTSDCSDDLCSTPFKWCLCVGGCPLFWPMAPCAAHLAVRP